MRTFEYQPDGTIHSICPFRLAYLEDQSVVYHGTSNCCEPMIESDGFTWQPALYTRDELDLLIRIFEQLYWPGLNGEAFAVLTSFTQSDFNWIKDQNRKPVFFTHDSQRTLRYAQRSCAGGETAQAVRTAFAELDTYLHDAENRPREVQKSWRVLRGVVRGEIPGREDPVLESVSYQDIRDLWRYYAKELRIFMRLGAGVRPAVEPVLFTERWLREQLDLLQNLRLRCQAVYDKFEYGVVYAVRLEEEDGIDLTRYSHDIRALKPIPPSRIIAKSIVHPKVFDEVAAKPEDSMID
jgi:hypothetical protein